MTRRQLVIVFVRGNKRAIGCVGVLLADVSAEVGRGSKRFIATGFPTDVHYINVKLKVSSGLQERPVLTIFPV